MKKFLLLSIILTNVILQPGYATSDINYACTEWASEQSSIHFANNTIRQINTSVLNGIDKQNATIRNLCFGAVSSKCVYLSHYGECAGHNESDILIYDITLSELQKCRDIDCFDCDISVAKNILQRIDGHMYDMFFPDINQIIKQILSGTMPNLGSNGTIDGTPSVCWDTDSQGDNIWHALVRMDMDLDSLASMCASMSNQNNQNAFYIAIIYSINKTGESPIHEAIRTNHTKLINWLKKLLYMDKATCIKLADEIYSQTEHDMHIDLQSIKYMLGC